MCVSSVAAQQMRAISKPAQGRRENAMALAGEQVAHALPAPGTVPGAMDEDELGHEATLQPAETSCEV